MRAPAMGHKTHIAYSLDANLSLWNRGTPVYGVSCDKPCFVLALPGFGVALRVRAAGIAAALRPLSVTLPRGSTPALHGAVETLGLVVYRFAGVLPGPGVVRVLAASPQGAALFGAVGNDRSRMPRTEMVAGPFPRPVARVGGAPCHGDDIWPSVCLWTPRIRRKPGLLW
jgi:hypothetical protein